VEVAVTLDPSAEDGLDVYGAAVEFTGAHGFDAVERFAMEEDFGAA